MAGRGPAPKQPGQRRRSNEPGRGEWRSKREVGWQHGKVPAPPSDLSKESIAAWRTWMGSWFAAHWTPSDLPGLRKVIRLYDAEERGQKVGSELRLMMDTYGITPKGQQDRHWRAPGATTEIEEPPVEDAKPAAATPYGHLTLVETA